MTEEYRKGKQVAFDDLEIGKTYFDKEGDLFDFVARSKRDHLYAFADFHEKSLGALIIRGTNNQFYETLPQRECWVVWWRCTEEPGRTFVTAHDTEREIEEARAFVTLGSLLHVQRVVYDGADE